MIEPLLQRALPCVRARRPVTQLHDHPEDGLLHSLGEEDGGSMASWKMVSGSWPEQSGRVQRVVHGK
eukprot:10526412-Lingulodinium_polyedra.AAC.1